MSDPVLPTTRATEPVASPVAIWAALLWVPLLVVMIGVVPRVWLPLLEREAGLGVQLLWVLALPLAAMSGSALLGYLVWDLRRRLARSRDLARDTVPRAKAFEEGGVTTLTGVLEGADIIAPLTHLPCVAWAQRKPGVQGIEPPSNVSHAAPFTLVLDDGTRVEAEGGAWRVADPFAPWTLVGESRIESGDRVRVRARVEVSLEPSDGDYRASAMHQRLVAEGGLIARAEADKPRRMAMRAAWEWPALACVAMLVHAIARLTQPAPMHFNVALGARCDGRHFCAARSYCDETPRAPKVCRRDCTRDAECGENQRCSEYSGRCETDYQSYGRPGTRTQEQDCTQHRCAPGFRCIRNLTRDDPDSGVYNGPESYCVRECRRDDQCPSGTVCILLSPETQPESWCDRLDNLIPVIRMSLEWRRDAAVSR